MENFSERLKEERERLGMSQAKFAESCGIGKSAQYSYENGSRQPPLSYVRAAEKIGVDGFYVQYGVRVGKDGVYAKTYKRLLDQIESILELGTGTLEVICDQGVHLEEQDKWGGDSWELSGLRAWRDGVQTWLATCSKPERCVDAALLARLLDSIDKVANKAGLSITTEKRVRAALMLYQGAKPRSGHLDQDVIDNAVKLASS